VTDKNVNVPRYIPLPPIPAMARPTISAFIVGAAPQSAEPPRKVRIDYPLYQPLFILGIKGEEANYDIQPFSIECAVEFCNR
jgi:hypothetical protein